MKTNLLRTLVLLALFTIALPTAPTAYAGHTLSGGWCENCTPGCINDPGILCLVNPSDRTEQTHTPQPKHRS